MLNTKSDQIRLSQELSEKLTIRFKKTKSKN